MGACGDSGQPAEKAARLRLIRTTSSSLVRRVFVGAVVDTDGKNKNESALDLRAPGDPLQDGSPPPSGEPSVLRII